MDTLSFINECFEKIGVAPLAVIYDEGGDVATEYGRLLVALYRCGVDYDINIAKGEIALAVTDPDGRLPDAYQTFRLTDLDWWDDFCRWLQDEKDAIIGAAA